MNFWHRLLELWTRDPLAVRVLKEQLEQARQEIRHWRDLFVQQLEQSRVVPRQPEHQVPPIEQPPQRKWMGEMQVEYQEQARQNYEAFKAEEERIRRLHKVTNAEPAANVN